VRLFTTRWLWIVLVAIVGCTQAVPPGSSPGAVASRSADGSGSSPGSAGAVAIGPSIRFSEEAGATAEGTATFDDGGTVRATAADGTTFTLEVPPRSVVEDTVIQMTPLAHVQGVGDGPAHAVRLQPEGLSFYEPARLTITPSTPIPIEDQVMFQATTTGDEVNAALVDVESEPIVLLLQHFSTAGAGLAAGEAEWIGARALNRLARISHEVGKVLQAERERQQRGEPEDPSVWDEVERLMKDAERDVLRPLLDASKLSCKEAPDGTTATETYVHALLALERQRALAGFATAETHARTITEVERASEASFKICEKEKIRECTQKRDPTILASFWVIWDRQRALRGEDPVAAVGDVQARARSMCLTDYRIDRTVTGSGGSAQFPITWSMHYTGRKCGGAVGAWTIDSAGTLTGGGDSAAIGGPITVQIAEGTLSGPLRGVANLTDEDQAPTQGIFTGTGKFNDDRSLLELTVAGGSGNGYNYGFLDTGVSGPGTLTLPAEEGDFCD
jgi:hypothetical protein